MYNILVHRIITDDEVDIGRKEPFFRLLIWSYIITEKDSLSSVDKLSKKE